jgi:hypothetical protein
MIDYSNGYPVQITTNVTKDTPWKEVFKKNSSLKKIFLDWCDDNWHSSNWKGPSPENYKDEEYKNVFLKLRFHGHITGQHYFAILDRYITKYKSDKDFRKKVDECIEMTNDLWKHPTNDIKFDHFMAKVKRTEYGQKYYKLENELITEFSKI